MISLLIVASGLLASRTLTRVDHDLRVFYAEYTLAVTDLGRVNGELIRYRTSVIRANEADTRQDYERIVASLPERRAHIDAAIERLVQASNDASLAGSTDARELTELKAVREKLEAYIVSSKHTIQLLEQRWRTSSRVEAQQLKNEAERHTAVRRVLLGHARPGILFAVQSVRSRIPDGDSHRRTHRCGHRRRSGDAATTGSIVNLNRLADRLEHETIGL